MRAKELLDEARMLLNTEITVNQAVPKEKKVLQQLPVFKSPIQQNVEGRLRFSSRKSRLTTDDMDMIKNLKVRERNLERIVSEVTGELKAFRINELNAVRMQISKVLNGNNQ